MAWKNQGGGPWSSGPKGPWGSGPQPVGPRPPDLEELLRRGQDRLKQLLPGGHFSGLGIGLIVAVIVAIWLASGFYRVESEELGIVLRFGKYVRDAQPGLNYHLPYPIETVLLPKALRVNTTSIGMRLAETPEGRGATHDVPAESLMLTGDENIIDINVTIFWKIDNAVDYLFNLRHPDALVKAVAESSLREVMGRTSIQPALTTARAQIEADVLKQTQQIMNNYKAGISIVEVQLQKVDPPAEVVESFRDVQRANTDAERMRNEAEAYRNDIVPRARGDAARIVAEAQGEKQATIAQATGQAQRFDAVLKSYQAARHITLKRMYIDTMNGIMAHAHTLVVDDRLKGLVPFLPLNLPQPQAASAANPPAKPAVPSLPSLSPSQLLGPGDAGR